MPEANTPNLNREGFQLIAHKSAIDDLTQAIKNTEVHREEIRRFLQKVTGADLVVVNGSGILRFGENSPHSGQSDNSKPARFVHIDMSKTKGYPLSPTNHYM